MSLGKILDDIAGAIETAAKDVISVALPIAKGAINTVEDAASRGIHLVRGDMNFDITGSGPQIAGGMRDLQPGDILIKQGGWDDPATAGIGAGQITLNRSGHKYLGAGLLGHAAIYVGNGEIVESGGPGVIRSKLNEYNPAIKANYSDYNWYVIRCKDAPIPSKMTELAAACVGKVDYNGLGLIPATVIGNSGAISHINKTRKSPTESDREKLKKGERPKMFCSEFVVFCLNCAADDNGKPRHISIDQDRVSPEELYVVLRDNSNFTYVGELHKGVR